MTPKRQKWWDSLPEHEKMLREQIWETKGTISKSDTGGNQTGKGSEKMRYCVTWKSIAFPGMDL